MFDTILGGGIPKEKIFLVTGAPGAGKSTIAGLAASAWHKSDPRSIVVYADAEQSQSQHRLQILGADINRTILISQGLTVESLVQVVSSICKSIINKNIPSCLFIWDSESATLSEKQLAAEKVESTIGYKAKLLSWLIPQFVKIATKYNITFLIIGQFRDKIQMNAYAPSAGDLKGLGDKTISGGNVMKYMPFQIATMKPSEDIKATDYGYAGIITKIKVIKNKLFTPNIEVELVLDYMNGYSDFWTKERLIRKCKGVTGGGQAQYLINDKNPETKKGNHTFTKKSIKDLYDENEEFRNKFEELYQDLKTKALAFPGAISVLAGEPDKDNDEESIGPVIS